MRFRDILTRAAAVARIIVALAAGAVSAQDDVAGVTGSPPVEEPGLKVADVERQLEKLKASGLDEAAQDLIRGKFSDVTERLNQATRNADAARYYRESLVAAPEEVVRNRQEIEAMPSPEDASRVDPSLGVEALRKELESRRAELAEITAELESAESELARVRGRPVEIGTRLPKARQELADAEAKAKAATQGEDPSLAKVAEGMMAQASRQALASEVEMLTQEQLSQAVREGQLKARRDLLQRKRENADALFAALGERLKQQMVTAREELDAKIQEFATRPGNRSPAWDSQLQELKELVDELGKSGRLLDSLNAGHRDLESRKDRIAQEYQRLQNQVKLGAIDGSFSQVLMRQLRRLPNPRPLASQLDARSEEIRRYLLASYRIEEKQREQDQLVKRYENDEDWGKLLAVRGELLGKLGTNYTELVRESTRFETDQRDYRDLIIEYEKFLSARLFLEKSSAPMGAEVFADIPDSVRWSFARENLTQLGAALKSLPARQPLPFWIVVGLVGGLLVFRQPLIRSIEKSGKRIKRISTDRYAHTLRALLDSLLLALPVPLAVGFVGIGLLTYPEQTDWVRGFGQGLLWVSVFLLWLLSLFEICRPRGLGEAHLNWDSRLCKAGRRGILWLVFIYLPLLVLVSTMVFEESARHFDSGGRIAFMLAHLVVFGVLIQFLNSAWGASPDSGAGEGRMFGWRFRFLLYPVLAALPLGLVVLAGIGYLWTALILSLEIQMSLRIMILGLVVYGLLVRWFTMRQRRIALEEELEQRRLRREQAEKTEDDEGLSDAIEIPEDELHLDEVVTQTRRLVRVVVGIGTVLAIWFLWSGTLPIDRVTKATLVEGGITWFSLLELALLIPISIIVVRNLPGLMDLAGLRSSGLDAGSRFALTTLCQYVVTAVALAMVFKLLDLDWSQFGWIAAALSVGLGFGLQEVVANFVCGIIILFERPIRIGDVVSLGDVTGTVSRIRMRATTITDWDRKDFVVPNKEFITGSLMNWTLSSPVNRVVIPVGVAYGSDTREARRILIEVAEKHPQVLDDPKPIATFEEFADSTLNLTLRCYLPNMENRLMIRTELCEAIDERFKEAGIEIAFPQQDLHLRSVEESILARKQPESDGKPASDGK